MYVVGGEVVVNIGFVEWGVIFIYLIVVGWDDLVIVMIGDGVLMIENY